MMSNTSTRRHAAAVLAVALVLTMLVGWSQDQAGGDVRVTGVEFASSEGSHWLELPVPSGVTEGDLLVAVVAVAGDRDVRGPDGWVLIRKDNHARQITQTVWTRQASGGEPASYAWNGTVSSTKTGTVLVLAGADPVTPVSATSAGTATRSSSVVLPSVTAGGSGDLLLGLFSMAAPGSIGAPEQMGAIGALSEAISVAVAVEWATSAGPSGERLVTRDVASGAAGQLLLISADPDPGTGGGPGEPDPDDGPDDPDPGEPDPDDEPSEPDPGEPDPDEPEEPPTGEQRRWNDPSSWPGAIVPSNHDDVVIDGHVVIDGAASARTVTVPAGSVLEFASDTSTTLEAFGNVVVRGTLVMRPASNDVNHNITFVDIDETAFVGGGHSVQTTDVGLWFQEKGRATIEGADKLPWTRAATSLSKGAHEVLLEEAPTGWQPGDELAITPTSAPGASGHSTGYSEARVVSITGRTVSLDTPLAFNHPRVAGQWGAEVMNLSRNVQVGGTAGGRSHAIFSHVDAPQLVRNVELRHMGPRQDTDETYRSGGQRVTITTGVLGRYPLHFHHMGAGSAGSVAENVVVRDSGHRAFVAHASDGITFDGTIAHDVFEAAYWWDGHVDGECCGRNRVWGPPSHDITYHRAIASLIRTDPPFRGHTLAGFQLGHGSNLRVTESVAVGVQGSKNASGFFWQGPNEATDNAWLFQHNVSHNNKVHGTHVWANTQERHVVESSVMYHNGEAGHSHGAYGNAYQYEGITLYGNGRAGVDLHAQGGIGFTDTVFDGGGVSQYGFVTGRHRFDRQGAIIRNPVFTGYTDRAVAFLASDPVNLDIVDPSFDGPESSWFHLASVVPSSSRIRVQLSEGVAFRLHPASSSIGTYVPAWNARREVIKPFS